MSSPENKNYASQQREVVARSPIMNKEFSSMTALEVELRERGESFGQKEALNISDIAARIKEPKEDRGIRAQTLISQWPSGSTLTKITTAWNIYLVLEHSSGCRIVGVYKPEESIDTISVAEDIAQGKIIPENMSRE